MVAVLINRISTIIKTDKKKSFLITTLFILVLVVLTALSIYVIRFHMSERKKPYLEIIWDSVPRKAKPRQTLSYRVKLRNNTNKTVENRSLLIDLPAEVDFVSGSAGAKYSYPFHTVRWTPAYINGKSTIYFDFKVKIRQDLSQGIQISPKAIIVRTDENEKFYEEMEGQWSPY